MGTLQALFVTTFYVGGTLALLGINPVKIVKDSNRENDLYSGKITQNLNGVEPDMKMTDVVVLKMFKTMGLSDATMAQIENDLRTSKNPNPTQIQK